MTWPSASRMPSTGPATASPATTDPTPPRRLVRPRRRPRRGPRCAVGTQRAFEQYCEKHPEQPVRVRIGLHTGEAIREAHDLFGKSVIMAARIAAQAEGQEILVSSLLKELTDSSGEFVFG